MFEYLDYGTLQFTNDPTLDRRIIPSEKFTPSWYQCSLPEQLKIECSHYRERDESGAENRIEEYDESE